MAAEQDELSMADIRESINKFKSCNEILDSGNVEDIMKTPLIDQRETNVYMDIQFPEHLPVQEESDVTQPAQPTRDSLT